MRSIAWAALAVFLGAAGAGCDDTTSVDGSRGPCVSGGLVLDCGDQVVTIEDACWKLVECGVIPIEHADPGREQDWGGCVDRLERRSETAAASIACVDLASCDQLIVNDSPNEPYEWPDCLEYQ